MCLCNCEGPTLGLPKGTLPLSITFLAIRIFSKSQRIFGFLCALRNVTSTSMRVVRFCGRYCLLVDPLVQFPLGTQRRHSSLRKISDHLEQLHSLCLINILNCETDCLSLFVQLRNSAKFVTTSDKMGNAKHL